MKQFILCLFSILISNYSNSQIPVCQNGISIEQYSDNGDIVLHTLDVDASSHTLDGSSFILRLNRIEDLNQNQQIDPNELLTTPPSTDSIVFSSGEMSNIHFVQLWIIDENNKADYCTTFVELNNNHCAHDTHISGSIYDFNGNNLEDHKVSLSESEIHADLTDDIGIFKINKPSFNSWLLGVESPIDYLNGVDRQDLIAIQEHILGTNLIESPFRKVAADVNNDGKISILDLIVLRKNLLNISVGFTNNQSWRYFTDWTDSFPFTFPVTRDFQSIYRISCVSFTQRDHNFIAVKIGDVVD